MRVIGVLLLCLFLVGVVTAGAQLTDSKTTALKDTAVNISNGQVSLLDIKNNIYISTTTEVDGVKFEPQTVTTDKDAVVYTDGKDAVSDYTIKMNYQYDGTRLKETITLKEDKELRFTLYLDENSKLIPWYNGQWKLVNKYNGNTMDGVVLEKPYGIDASGKYIYMDYIFEKGVLKLVYNRTIKEESYDIITQNTTYNYKEIQYPLIIDPTWTSVSGCWTATSGAYTLIMWNATGTTTWTVPVGVTNLEYLVVAGGGGGAASISPSARGGGGGAGGMLNSTAFTVASGDVLTVTVGAGGYAGLSSGQIAPQNGTNSTLGNTTTNITAIGGGGGAGLNNSAYKPAAGGGSGGGGIYNNPAKPGGLGTAGQGFNGGNGSTGRNAGAGGGGACSVGVNVTSSVYPGGGGNGCQNNITGVLTYYAGGGGGGANADEHWAYGGSGGGGNGGNDSVMATQGADGFGGGGGGAGASLSSYNGAAGGSGVVIIKYMLPLGTAFTTDKNTTYYPFGFVQFTDTTTGVPMGWNWSFKNVTGNNTEVWFNQTQNPLYIFGVGNWSIKLNTTDGLGVQNKSIQTTFINVSTMTVNYTKNVSSGSSPTGVLLCSTSTGATPTSYIWYFTNVTGNNTEGVLSNTHNTTVTLLVGNWSIRTGINRSSGDDIGYNLSTSAFVNVSRPGYPISNFTSNITGGQAPVAVQFYDNTTNKTTGWSWYFNNVTGNATNVLFSTSQHPIHAFWTGNHSIYLIVSNIDGTNTSTKTYFINSSAAVAPVASWVSNITNGTVPQVIQFTDTSSNFPTSWQWNFTNVTDGGSSTQFSTSQNPTITFTISANYLINLTATNSYGTTSSTGWINLTTPISSFTVSETSGLYPLDVTFNDTSGWINATNWTWWFGDGTYSVVSSPSSPNVTHTYFSPGTYYPTMTIQNATYTGYADSPSVITVSGSNQLFATIHTTRFTYLDWSGTPISGINVTIVAMNSTTPQEWAFSLFNINLGATPIDSTYLTGLTDESGSVTFVTLQTAYYQVQASKPSLNINQINYFSGANEQQTITLWTEQQRIAPYDYHNTFWQAPAAGGNITLGVNYTGTGDYATNVTYYITNQSGALIYQQSVTNTSAITFQHEVVPEQGKVYYWGTKINSSGYGDQIIQQQFIRFNNSQWLYNPLKAPDGDTNATNIYGWSAFALVVLIGAISSKRSLKQGGVVTTGVAMGFQYLGWLPIPFILVASAFALSIIIYIRFAEEESSS